MNRSAVMRHRMKHTDVWKSSNHRNGTPRPGMAVINHSQAHPPQEAVLHVSLHQQQRALLSEPRPVLRRRLHRRETPLRPPCILHPLRLAEIIQQFERVCTSVRKFFKFRRFPFSLLISLLSSPGNSSDFSGSAGKLPLALAHCVDALVAVRIPTTVTARK